MINQLQGAATCIWLNELSFCAHIISKGPWALAQTMSSGSSSDCHTIAIFLQAEELIKTEMLMMLRNDLIYHPKGQISKANLTKIKADYDTKLYGSIPEEEVLQVS